MDQQKKKEQVEAIDEEVKALHPLLMDIFQRFENVTLVEYTHGPNEMGADFVIERFDNTLGETYYVGVVAKTDKILQNFIEVERQIDECGVPRKIRQGKQEVRLPEVWVITTKSYSQNAKIKIADKYPNRKIHFFGSDWLVSQIDRHAPYYWHQLPNATGVYLASLSRTISELDAQTSLLQLPSGETKYIELDIEEVESDRYKKKRLSNSKPRLVNFIEEVKGNKITLLEAEMGFGKSKLARRIVTEYANPQVLKSTQILPIFMPFKIFSEQKFESLNSRIESILGNDTYLEAKASNYSFLLVLDGLDEANRDVEHCRQIISDLVIQVREQNNIKLLVTSRPFKLLEQIPDLSTSIKRYSIRSLSPSKLIRFIREVCEQSNLPNRLYEDLAKSPLFKQLPQNPIAASLLSNLLQQNKHDLPSNLTELYSKSIEYMLGRWDEKRSLSTEKAYKDCERLARHLARYMIDNQLIYVSIAEAREMFQQFSSERNTGVSVDEVIDYLLNRSHLFGVLQDTETIFFRHRSFAEYLYALDAHALRNLTIDEKAFHPYWTNTYFFYVGLLTECPELLQQLVALPQSDERSRWLRLLHMSNYLLAGYQSRYSIIEQSLPVLFSEFAQLYTAVRNGTSITKLGELSEMKLLWMFAMLIKHSYGYEFFRKALPLAMADLDDSALLNKEEKIAAMFFAACALNELNDKCGFVFLLQKYKTEELPLTISLGLQCEAHFSGKNFSNDPIIKLHDKKLKKLLNGDKKESIATQQKLDELFEKPIKTKHSLNSKKTTILGKPNLVQR